MQIQSVRRFLFADTGVKGGQFFEWTGLQQGMDDDGHRERTDDDCLYVLHQEFCVGRVGLDAEGVIGAVYTGWVGAVPHPQLQVDLRDFSGELIEHRLHYREYLAPDALLLLVHERYQILQDSIVGAEFLEIELPRSDRRKLLSGDPHKFFRKWPRSNNSLIDWRKIIEHGTACFHIVKKLGSLHKSPILLRRCKSQSEDGFDGVEQGVGVGEFKFHVSLGELVEVVEVV